MAESLDGQYWKYSVLRIKYTALKKPINAERLTAKRLRIKEIQEELSVALAHLRTASINVIDCLIRLRYVGVCVLALLRCVCVMCLCDIVCARVHAMNGGAMNWSCIPVCKMLFVAQTFVQGVFLHQLQPVNHVAQSELPDQDDARLSSIGTLVSDAAMVGVHAQSILGSSAQSCSSLDLV